MQEEQKPLPPEVSPAPEALAPLTANEAPPPAPKANPVRKIALFGGAMIALSLAWHIASDQLAPSSHSGAVVAYTTQIAPRVSGQVVEVLVADNKMVVAGDALFALDPVPFDLAVRQAEIALKQALAAVGASQESLLGAQAQVDQAQAGLDNARANAERLRALSERGIVPKAQRDAADNDLRAAEASLAAAQASAEAARRQLGAEGENNPQIMAAELQLEQALLNRRYATVVAPSDGVVTNLRLVAGQYVTAGSPSLTFIDAVKPWIVMDLRENQLVHVSEGDRAHLLFDAVPGQIFEARVHSIARGIDPGRTMANGLPVNQPSNRWFEPARTIPVHLELSPETDWPMNVRAGSKVGAVIFTGSPNNPVALVSRAVQWVQSYVTYLF